MRIRPAPNFGRDIEWLAAFLTEPGKQLFTASVPICIRRVKEIHAQIQSTLQCSERLFIPYISPCAANGPCAKTDRGNAPTCAPKFTILHHDVSSKMVSMYCTTLYLRPRYFVYRTFRSTRGQDLFI